MGRHALRSNLRQALTEDMPHLLVTAGRQSALLSRIIGKQQPASVKRIHILNPRIDPGHFDLVITPSHDGLAGPNVVTTTGSLNVIDKTTLDHAATQWAGQYAQLPSPRQIVLIGGSNRAYTISDETIRQLASAAQRHADQHGGSILVSLAPRSSEQVQASVLRHFGQLAVEVWRGGPENPYLGYLAYADSIAVTPDSINMVSEACAVGVPVAVDYTRITHSRFRRFYQQLADRGHINSMSGPGQVNDRSPLRETQAVAQQVRDRLELQMEPERSSFQ